MPILNECVPSCIMTGVWTLNRCLKFSGLTDGPVPLKH